MGSRSGNGWCRCPRQSASNTTLRAAAAAAEAAALEVVARSKQTGTPACCPCQCRPRPPSCNGVVVSLAEMSELAEIAIECEQRGRPLPRKDPWIGGAAGAFPAIAAARPLGADIELVLALGVGAGRSRLALFATVAC